MKKIGSRGKQKKGKVIQCPRADCKYKWRVKNPNKPFICCSRCKRYFKNENKKQKRKRRKR